MPGSIDRDEVRRLQASGAQIVEVLEHAAYDRAHLPEAVQIHLSRLDHEAPAALDASRAVVVYCADGL